MTVTATSFKARRTEFAALADDTVTAAIEEAELQTNRTHWGSKADLSVIYLAAHLLACDAKIAANAAARGPLTSETIGPLSWSYAAPAAPEFSDAWYASTEYGKAYVALRGTLRLSRAL